MEEENNEQNSPDQKNDKIEKKYQNSINRLIAVVGGKEHLYFPKRIPSDKLSDVVSDLFKEENDALLVEVKNGLRNILKSYAEMLNAFKQKEEELAKLQKQKKEEFAKAAEALFKKIDQIGDIEKSYYDGLSSVIKAES